MRRKSGAGKFVDDKPVFPYVQKLLMRNVIAPALMNRCKSRGKVREKKKKRKRNKCRVRERANY